MQSKAKRFHGGMVMGVFFLWIIFVLKELTEKNEDQQTKQRKAKKKVKKIAPKLTFNSIKFSLETVQTFNL